jgi:benzoyl-CoA reductase subunit D
MITMGIDIGAKTIKVLLLKDGEVLAKDIAIGGLEEKKIAEELAEGVLKKAGLSRDDVDHVVTTGAGRKSAPYFDDEVTEIGAAAKGTRFLFPSARTVIEVGAEEGRGTRCDESGRVTDFVINEKCAAGSGAFTESMSRALEVSIEDFAQLSLKSTKQIPMNAQCAVFAESEVVSLVHAKTSKEDIARAVHDALAERVISMVRRVGIERDVAIIGGMARNPGFIDSLQRGLEFEVLVPQDPDFIGALGAALTAADQ